MPNKPDLQKQLSQKVCGWFALPFTWTVTPLQVEFRWKWNVASSQLACSPGF